MDTKNLKVVMLPWLAYGHISPYLELSKKLSKNNFSVHFCSTPVILDSIKPKLQQDENYPSLNLVEINLPSVPDLPAESHKTTGLPSHLLPLLAKTFIVSAPGITKSILETIKPDLIIFDIMQPWIPSMASSLGIPAVHFQITGVIASAYFYQRTCYPDVEFPFPGICLNKVEIKMNEDRDREFARPRDNGNDKVNYIHGCLEGSSEIILVKCCDEMEGKYMDYTSDLYKKRLVSVGSLVNESVYVKDHREGESEILEWLDKKEESSTVFVCFGSESCFSKEEMEELAYGLEGSNVNFIWVIWASPGQKIMKVEEILPKGFVERVKEKGKIVLGWAPQAKILKHSSIGGFLSHCGLSSVMESLSYGVPIIAMPVQYEQPLNARVLVDIGVAVEVVRDENGVAKKKEVAKVIKEVVVEKHGGEVRKKARELGEKVRAKGDEDIDNLVKELQKLCKKYYNANKTKETGNAGN